MASSHCAPRRSPRPHAAVTATHADPAFLPWPFAASLARGSPHRLMRCAQAADQTLPSLALPCFGRRCTGSHVHVAAATHGTDRWLPVAARSKDVRLLRLSLRVASRCVLCLALPAVVAPYRASLSCCSGRVDSRLGHVLPVPLPPVVVCWLIALTPQTDQAKP